MPDQAGRSLSVWFCGELAKELAQRGIVERISAQSVQRMLASHKLKPWRVHHWLGHKETDIPEFRERTEDICFWYTCLLPAEEVVLCLDEKTSLQPRTRSAATQPAQVETPVRIEHEYARKGALNLLAAFDTRTGEVQGICRRRKRQVEFLELLEVLEKRYPPSIERIHVICDNARIHTGKQVQQWLKRHPRFCFHFTPVHCSWMNQIEQWFSILQRKRLTAPNFASLEALEERLHSFIREWNLTAHPFQWSEHSFEKIRAKFSDEKLLLFPSQEKAAA